MPRGKGDSRRKASRKVGCRRREQSKPKITVQERTHERRKMVCSNTRKRSWQQQQCCHAVSRRCVTVLVTDQWAVLQKTGVAERLLQGFRIVFGMELQTRPTGCGQRSPENNDRTAPYQIPRKARTSSSSLAPFSTGGSSSITTSC
jgi:hypothetical protein